MGKKIIESVTIENAALYNRIYDSSSVTIELYSWYVSLSPTMVKPMGSI